MEGETAFHDPLTFNVHRQKRKLASKFPTLHVSLSNAKTLLELLNLLSHLLTVPAFTSSIATLFRPILFDLCVRFLEKEGDLEDEVVALCFLIQVHEELFPIIYQILLRPQFSNGLLPTSSIGDIRTQRLLLALFRILLANRELPSQLLWPLSPLHKLSRSTEVDNCTRLLAIRCYALQSGMGEAERVKWEHRVVGKDSEVDCPLDYGVDEQGVQVQIDGWLLPVLEYQRVRDARNALITEDQSYYAFEEDENERQGLDPSVLSPLVANVHGVFLLRASPQQDIISPLISTPTAVSALRSLALHLSGRFPILLTSPPSSGKALFLTHLAQALFSNVKNQIVLVQLADTSLDARSLLGNYVSSVTQLGVFEWKEGVLVRALREGKWVILKDIDRASNDVLGLLKPLIESLEPGKWIGGRATIDVPGHGKVIAADSFAVFGTRSVMPGHNGTFPTATFFGAHKFHEVIVPTPSTDELRSIINVRFPRLAGGAGAALIRMWEAIRAIGSTSSTRDIGLRDLEKYCTRVEGMLPASQHPMDVDIPSDLGFPLSAVFPNLYTREEMYLAAREVYFGAGGLTTAARTHIQTIAQAVGEHLDLDIERRDWLLNNWKPQDSEFGFERDVNGVVTGVMMKRARIESKPQTKLEVKSMASSRPFAMHRPATILLSRIVTAVSLGEPILLTGETGTGKTSVITHLANTLRQPLISLNLSHQTESSDLLGGFRPVDTRIPGIRLFDQWLDIFVETFSRKKNEAIEKGLREAVQKGKWKQVVSWWKGSIKKAKEQIQKRREAEDTTEELDSQNPRKRRRLNGSALNRSEAKWTAFEQEVDEFNCLHVEGKGKFAFAFIEGPLVKALRVGDWVLLDEINLAGPETLECISSILQSPTGSITLTEQGSLEPVPRHPNFRLFACMNPATDVGKKDLPPNIRSRFTEIDVPPPDADQDTLLSIVEQYIGHCAVGDKKRIHSVAEFYLAVKKLAETRQIADGSNHRPHFSMRTLTRALTFAADIAQSYGLKRAVWEGCMMAFTMVLDHPSAQKVVDLAKELLLPELRNNQSTKAFFSKTPSPPQPSDNFVKFGTFYLEKGPLPEDPVEDYVMTPSVYTKLTDLARIILTRRFPVLIEGPTSSGKTSAVEYLAKRTGHRFIRINNHDHTDIQEYLGSYVPDPQTGKLVFTDGLLVRALRNGDWIVLDELNLAPTDVLEALNRLLDDNRELVIPETGEVIRPHPHFMLFATQNPPGLYAGRKVLSRAFRNRFLEVHFEDVPEAELQTILCERCRIAPSRAEKIVSVFRELQKRRQSGRVFESKHGFATLRDLFRWGDRQANSDQELAEDGYMLLAERTRREDDKVAVKEVIESIMRAKLDENALYDLNKVDCPSYLQIPCPSSSSLVWTNAMSRLFILVSRALRFNEPVLLVGETGCGKTSVCQEYAATVNQELHALNCHQNTETADMIGGLRPVRNRGATEAELLQDAKALFKGLGVKADDLTFITLEAVIEETLRSQSVDDATAVQITALQQRLARVQSIFEWHDGPLVEAMRKGDVFLLDEISLADDSVLERLNSVLEPSRTIVLAEKGGNINSVVEADLSFKFVATMNPGGDYGKKELSPALRNRFTEIWVPAVDSRGDLEMIVSRTWRHVDLTKYTSAILDFIDWLSQTTGDRSFLNLRDILAWVVFSNVMHSQADGMRIPEDEIFHHAAHMTFLDGLASVPSLLSYSPDSLQRFKTMAVEKLRALVPTDIAQTFVPSHNPKTFFQLGSFAIPRGPKPLISQKFNFQAPTSQDNAMRVVRACQLGKPILLEGSPGVGKTSLITALATMAGHPLCRINLSDQTDIIDLFGSDLPVEGGGPGEFSWKDGEFLKALQEGSWVLLDEMNLAPQAMLEGLNAVLDHRGTIYIPELGRSFVKHPSFRIFAAQNPLSQGGGRKGLPKSFMNRFTKVYIDQLSAVDLVLVCRHYFPDMDPGILQAMVTFNSSLNDVVSIQKDFAREGSPWEFNLRDVLRWCSLVQSSKPSRQPVEYLRPVYLHRFRTAEDRQRAQALYNRIFGPSTVPNNPAWSISPDEIQMGVFHTRRENCVPPIVPKRILRWQLSALEAMGCCLSRSWLSIVTGPRNSGKTSLVRLFAHLMGHPLHEISINSATDTMDILGGFEQTDRRFRYMSAVKEALLLADKLFRSSDFEVDSLVDDYIRLKCVANQQSSPLSTIVEIVGRLLSKMIDALPAEVGSLQNEVLECNRDFGKVGRFQWVDGPLVKAMKEGRWILLDGANLCSPSVLDRLNSLCEEDGFLTLSERGYVNGEVQILKPTPGFRLFMSVDPQHGELSRAMRNRGIEIALIPDVSPNDLCVLHDYWRLPSCADPRLLPSTLHFEGVRRATFVNLDNASVSMPTSGRALDQYSYLAPLLDQTSILLKSIVDDTNWTALQSYVSRTVPPASIPSFIRFFTRLDGENKSSLVKLNTLLQEIFPTVETSLACFREEYIFLYGVSRMHTINQPMDPYLFLPEGICDNVGSIHLHVLRVLEVILTATNSKRRRVPEDKLHDGQNKHDITHRAMLAADSLISEVTLSCRMIVSNALTTEHDQRKCSLHDLSVAILLLKYTQYLSSIIAESVFDFSSVQTIAQWILEAAEIFSSRHLSLLMWAKTLKNITSLSSGLGLNEIWRSFSSQTKHDFTVTERLEKLGSLAFGNGDLRGQVFNLMAVASLPLESGNESLTEGIIQGLEQGMPQNASVTKDTDPIPTITILGLLIRSERDLTQSLKHSIVELLNVVRLHPTTCLSKMVPFQHFLWIHESSHDSMNLRRQLQFRWMKDLWVPEEESSPADLFSAISLKRTLSVFDWSRLRLCDLATYELTLKIHNQLCLVICEQYLPRIQQIQRLLRTSIDEVASWFVNPGEELSHSNDLDFKVVARGFPGRFNKHRGFVTAVETHLQPALLRLDVGSDSYTDLLHNIGSCWVSIGLMILDLFVPNAPIDPIAVQNCSKDYWEHEQFRYSTEMALHLQLEEITTGNKGSHVVAYIRGHLDEANQRLRGYPVSHRRRNTSVLHKFWAEVHQFQQQILLPSRINTLIDLFGENPVLAHQQEEVLQKNISGFSQRLEHVYKDFVDIILPIQYALLVLKMGLRIIRQSSTDSHTDDRLGTALSAFPSIRGSELVLSQSRKLHESDDLTAFQHVLLSCASIGLHISAGVSIMSRFSNLDIVYEQALRLWGIDRSREKEREKMSQSLYKNGSSSHQALSDAEIEQAEFMELFPSFESVLSEDTQASNKTAKPTFSMYVSDSDARRLVNLHEQICFFHLHDRGWEGGSDYRDMRTQLLSTILSSRANGLTEGVDLDSLFLQLSLLDRRSALLLDPTFEQKSYNFYLHTNIPQSRKAVDVVRQLKLRLGSLIQEWPDQMVLQHLESRCDAFLALDLHSPLAKILSALEQLLLQTEDWEMYANKDNNLKPNRTTIINLIVEWRRLELSSWRALLENQALEFEAGVSNWWFQLYNALIRGPSDAWARSEDGNGQVSKYLHDLIPLLDDFIRGSPLGQFHARMRLLHSFEIYCGHYSSSTANNKPIFEPVRNVVHATLGYFSLFSEPLATYLTAQTSALESEVLNLVKLAGWKDVNVHALKQSAQRSHHQLYKIVRRFREVLREPIADRLLPLTTAGTEGQRMSIELPPFSYMSGHEVESVYVPVSSNLTQAKSTYTKFSQLIHSRIRPFVVSKDGNALDEFAVEIIVISKQLATTSLPTSSVEKREKHAKALLNRKRKAWSDLLKELKKAGFSPNVRSEVLLQNTSVRWTRDQPIITGDSPSIKKAENYLHRLNGALPGLRASLSNHHTDLGARELQRGIMFLESAFSMSVDSKKHLARLSSSYLKLEASTRRLAAVTDATSIVSSGPQMSEQLIYISDALAKTVSALSEVETELGTYNRRNPTDPVPQVVFESCRSTVMKSSDLQKRLQGVIQGLSELVFPILTEVEGKVVQEVVDFIEEAICSLKHCSEIDSRLKYLFTPTINWLVTLSIQHSFEFPAPSTTADGEIFDNIINACLVTVQGLLTKCPESTESQNEDDRDNYIKEDCRDIRDLCELLKVEPMLNLLQNLFVSLAAQGSGYHADLQRVIPYLDIYTKLVQTQLAAHSHFNAAFFKFNFVLCSVLQTLSNQGFCKPPDETPDDGKGAEGTTEMMDGVGMGEGSGNQNVSKEIEEESQVEGLKGEKAEDGESPEDKDNDAIEMDQDFDGEMQDVPEEGEPQEGDDDKSEGSDADPEEQIGDLDISDPAAVDEKLWGDEKGPQDSDDVEQKTNEDHSATKGGESDVVAKEGGEKESKQKEDPAPEDQPLLESQQQEEESEMPGVSGAPMDEHVPEADTLDLPDNMDMNSGEDIPDEMDLGEDINEVEPEIDSEQPVEDLPQNDSPDHHQDPVDEPENDDTSGKDEADIPEPAQAESGEGQQDECENPAVAQPDISTGDGDPNQDIMNPETGASPQDGEKGTKTGVGGEDPSMSEDKNQDSEMRESRPIDAPDQAEESNANPTGAASGAQQGRQQPLQSSQLTHNPLRSLGDALKEVQQRFDEILHGEECDIPREQQANAGDPSQVEYLRPDDTDHEMQALGPSEEEQASKLKDLRIAEDTNNQNSNALPMDTDIDMDCVDPNLQPPPSHERATDVDHTASAHQEDVEGAIVNDASSPSHERAEAVVNPDGPKADIEMEEEIAGSIVEAELRSWQSDGLPDDRAEHIWRLYESLTHDLAYALCEQLRLILEPTLATRLKGDYRTGKRLNMKKIIPYIASDYTKDKIWLRRTRPSQREYQILIALDDSKSMAESHSVHLAYQTLGLVSKALSRLESGDMGIARFGETVEVLHGFEGTPFTDQTGVEVMKAFRFNQKATNVLSLVETSLKVLEAARERKAMSSSTAADLWQLEMIISDGMCQDHEKLRPILRKAEEQKVMIVFIIIDSLHTSTSSSTAAHGSILSMTKAEIVNVNGKMDMQIQRYLDSFPFEYYVVLRNVEALPEVLSTTLKQFFERISEE